MPTDRALADARAEGRREGIEAGGRHHDEKAAVHARGALWMGRNRERWEGVPPAGVEACPMNGPAVAYLHEIGAAAAIRALSTPPEPQGDGNG